MKGLHEYRLPDNPEERRLSEAFKEFAKDHLAYLLHVGDQGGAPPILNEHDATVACTVIQWLGSPVGQNWLRDMGYVRTDEQA
jgi:hypothetical protein